MAKKIIYKKYYRVWFKNFHYYAQYLFHELEEAKKYGKDSGFAYEIETYEKEEREIYETN